jgi:hypothetical protein
MFDNLDDKNNQTAPAPGNIPVPEAPKLAEDIFSGTKDSAPVSAQNASGSQNPQNDEWSQVDPGIDSIDLEKQGKKKVIMLMLMLIGMVLIGWGTYYAFGKIVKSIGNFGKTAVENTSGTETAQNPAQTENNINKAAADATVAAEKAASAGTSTEAYIPSPAEVDNADSDKDGLTDAEEKILGTNPQKVDSDDDGLFDREEVKIYKTDPLNPDTDGDGFTDGEEVKSGYNPKGDGRLYGINTQTAQ